MKLSELIELYKLLDNITNGGDRVEDFGIEDGRGEIWAATESGATFAFSIEKEKAEDDKQ